MEHLSEKSMLKAAIKMYADKDFVQMRIDQQRAYIKEKQNQQRWQRYEDHVRIKAVIDSARERLSFFEQLLAYLNKSKDEQADFIRQ